jgi:hypothetical protein
MTVRKRRLFRQQLAAFCHRWRNAYPGQRVPGKLIDQFKAEAGMA